MDSLGVREIYDQMVSEGQHPNMAAMLAARKSPGTWNTDNDFCRREQDRMKNMGDEHLETINKMARAAGINTTGKTYNGGLGRYTDPDAWVSSTSDVRRVAIKKEMNIGGMVNVNGYRGPKKKTRIAKDILDKMELNARKRDPSLDQKCKKSKKARMELRESITEKHTKPRD